MPNITGEWIVRLCREMRAVLACSSVLTFLTNILMSLCDLCQLKSSFRWTFFAEHVHNTKELQSLVLLTEILTFLFIVH